MKRKIITVGIIFLLFNFVFVHARETIFDVNDVGKKLDIINKELIEFYRLKGNYFLEENDLGLPIIEDFLGTNNKEEVYIVYNHEGQPDKSGIPFVNEEKMVYRYLGYNIEGGRFSNPDFPWDAGWGGRYIEDFDYVKNPWRNPLLEDK